MDTLMDYSGTTLHACSETLGVASLMPSSSTASSNNIWAKALRNNTWRVSWFSQSDSRDRAARGESPFQAVSLDVSSSYAKGYKQATSFRHRPAAKDLVVSLHERSGLTWEQLAQVLGVSRRSLHLWAKGARVSKEHYHAMEQFDELLTKVNVPPEDMKRYLFTPRFDGRTPLDIFRKSLDRERVAISGPALLAYQML